jgi:peptidyl-prolyl cis-trans isomerase D
MIAFIRKFLESKLVIGLFAAIILAFMITGFGSGSGGLSNLALSGDTVASMGSMNLTNAEVTRRVQAEFAVARQEQPGLKIEDFDRQGGIDQSIDRLINTRVILAFAEKHGMVISDRLIDSEIAKTPSFYGPAGKFDRNVYLAALGQRNVTERAHREDVQATLLAAQIVPAATGAAKAPTGLQIPYASLLLEKRFGQTSFVAASAFAGSPATEVETKAFYDHNLARYTVPETRIIRYALFDRARFVGKVQATDVEIEAAYKTDSDKYAATERRVLTQIIATDEGSAKALVAKARGGMSLSEAAKEAGLDATTLDPQDKKTFASLASPAAADAAFKAASGSVVDAAKSGLGWHVIHVDKVVTTSGTTLAQARSQIEPKLTQRKIDEALADMVVRMEDAIDKGATFDEVVSKEGLEIITTPAVTASGIAPGNAAFKVSADLAPILKDAFQSEADDDAAVINVVEKQKNAILKLDHIVPATAKPLAQIHAQVSAEAQADKAARAARKEALAIVAKVNAGTPLSGALGSKGPTQPLNAMRVQIAQAGSKAPPVLATLFKLAPRKAKMVEAEDGKGYTIVWLERLEPGNAADKPELLNAASTSLSEAMGNEYMEQLLTAMKADVGAMRNEAAIIALKRSLRGGGSGAQ